MKKVKIIWEDAIIYNHNSKDPTSVAKMETSGFLIEENNDDWVAVKTPLTKNIETGKIHPEKQPNFYCIPKKSIISLE